MPDPNKAIAPGWAEALGRELGGAAAGAKPTRPSGVSPLRRTWSQDFAAGMRGGEHGRASRRLDTALGELPEGMDGEAP